MSFRCDKCLEPRPNKEFPGEYTPNRVVIATRNREEVRPSKGYGMEIAKEQNLCKRCLQKLDVLGSTASEV